jgi:hypothetical protein
MDEHRIRLKDREIELIVSALRARENGVSEARARELERLAERLAEGVRGNPNWILGAAIAQARYKSVTD